VPPSTAQPLQIFIFKKFIKIKMDARDDVSGARPSSTSVRYPKEVLVLSHYRCAGHYIEIYNSYGYYYGYYIRGSSTF
jgi:hypothetical protein